MRQARSSLGETTRPALPPPFTALRLREHGDAFAHAKTIAATSGAGMLVHVGRFDLVEFALVLEPEEPLRYARRAFYAGMNALAVALINAAAPETSLSIGWPDAFYINLGLVGGGRLAWPAGAGEDEMPDWLVFGAMIRLQATSDAEPGLNPQVTSLMEEGFKGETGVAILESFARHFMLAIDSWQEGGFDPLASDYLQQLDSESGFSRSLADNGDLLLRRVGNAVAERHSLTQALLAPSWLDAATGEPRT